MDIGVGHQFTERAIRRCSENVEAEKEANCIRKSVNRNGLEMLSYKSRDLYYPTMAVLSY
jgi:Fe-S cluster assembly iron-binding protein IscA